jgi:hypothetical protein
MNSLWEKLWKLYFIAAVFTVGVGYGFLIHKNHWFPYGVISQAWLAGAAVLEINTELHAGQMPATFKSFEDNPDISPPIHHFETQPQPVKDEWILVTGGPYENLEQCPTFGCLAWVMDRQGKIIHHWEVDLDALWAEADHMTGLKNPWNFKPLGIELLPDGSIIAAFYNNFAFPEGAGLAKFDIEGNLVWIKKDHSHHWFTTDNSGRIYTPAHHVIETPFSIGNTSASLDCPETRAKLDVVGIVDPHGKTVETLPLIDILVDSGYAAVIQGTQDPCDPLHLNFVQYIDSATAARIPGAKAGDLLLSMRNVNALALLDPRRRKLKWLLSDRTMAQHSPRFLPDGSFVVFDNLGGNKSFGGSRITRHQIGRDRVETLFPRAPLPQNRQFFTEYVGHIDVHPQGHRALVSVTETGKLWEIDLSTGELLWEYEKLFNAEHYPGWKGSLKPWVRVENFGGYYVDKTVFAKALAGTSVSRKNDRTFRKFLKISG